MTILLYTLGVVVFAFALLASIALHELGHMVPAKRFGGKVTQYFVGFGPTVWSRQIGETEYGIKAIPLGGYVKIVGMLPPDPAHPGEESVDADGNRVVTIRGSSTGMFTQLIADARAAEAEHVKPEDSDRLFYKLAWWKKVIVMSGGPAMNLLIAFGIFWALFASVGNVVGVKAEPVVAEVLPCIVPAEEDGRACTAAELRDHPTPAAAAGLEDGDVFVSFNGAPIADWEEIQQAIRDNSDREAVLGIERDGELIEVPIRTQVVPRPLDADAPAELTPVGFLGIRPVSEPIVEYGGPVYTVRQMGSMTVTVAEALVTLPAKVYHVGLAVIGLEERDPEGPVSIVGGGRMAGEVAAHEALSTSDKVIAVATIIAGFNLFIGMFNLVPLLPLDGGHIAGALYEQVRRLWARLWRRPDPGFVDVAKMLPVAYVVAASFLVMGVVLIVADFVVPVRLFS